MCALANCGIPAFGIPAFGAVALEAHWRLYRCELGRNTEYAIARACPRHARTNEVPHSFHNAEVQDVSCLSGIQRASLPSRSKHSQVKNFDITSVVWTCNTKVRLREHPFPSWSRIIFPLIPVCTQGREFPLMGIGIRQTRLSCRLGDERLREEKCNLRGVWEGYVPYTPLSSSSTPPPKARPGG
jgi:hypothetical protein